jgi:ubiquitin-protein ligase
MQVYHPNIDLEGNVCLNILREDWKPVLNINTVIYGLNLLFTVFHLSWIPIDSKNMFLGWKMNISTVLLLHGL